MFGRRVCTAKNPKCIICPVKDNCPSSKQFLSYQRKVEVV
ncbi:MAG: hypothetical protein QW134_07090 [Nitrososphaeria archaeon]